MIKINVFVIFIKYCIDLLIVSVYVSMSSYMLAMLNAFVFFYSVLQSHLGLFVVCFFE